MQFDVARRLRLKRESNSTLDERKKRRLELAFLEHHFPLATFAHGGQQGEFTQLRTRHLGEERHTCLHEFELGSDRVARDELQDLTEARLVRRFDGMPHEMLDDFIALIQTIFDEILPAHRTNQKQAWHRGLVVGVQERQGLGILRGKGHPALLQKSTRHLGANLHEDMLSLHGYLVVTHQ